MRKFLGKSVLEAARGRIKYTFNNFKKVYLSFSGGKDSTVMLHLVMEEAQRRGVKVPVMFIDLEGQYKLTIDHVQACYDLYAENIVPYWICLPINLRNAVSQYEPQWVCWEHGKEDVWIREKPSIAIKDETAFPFFFPGMEFEQFVPKFGEWISGGEDTACFVGIRSQESIHRWVTVAGKNGKKTFNGLNWTTEVSRHLFNVYPIYDWKTEDIWRYHGKNLHLPINRLYDRMHQAGLTIHQQRICQPYGDDQRKGLWLFHLIEPETWSKIVARVNGANQGALYAQTNGNILGNVKITKPDGHTWESFAYLLLESMPKSTSEHYKNKIAIFLKWWADHGVDPIPDEGPNNKKSASWSRICKVLLRNDYWCKGLSFTQTDPKAYNSYKKLMEKRRKEWNIMT
jgi:predicted phosphoadenosine phosphosulfate sulfurtransferase